jgi:hypothetical protein
MNFLRSLQEIRCLSQALPNGIRSPLLLSPKTVKHPRISASCASPKPDAKMRGWWVRQGHAGVAQLVEHLICNQRVGGSNPSAGSTDPQSIQ